MSTPLTRTTLFELLYPIDKIEFEKMKKRKFLSDQNGVSMLEFSISAALFYLLILGIIIWALVMWQMNTVQYAVERGARCAILQSPPNDKPKLCIDPLTYAADQSFGFSGVTNDMFELKSTPLGVGATAYTADCVSTSTQMRSVAAAMPFIQLGSDQLQAIYCRPQQ